MIQPKLLVSGNYLFTDKEILEIADSIPSHFDVEANRIEEFQADELLPYIVLVFLNPIVQGYLNAIGADLWAITKSVMIQSIQKKDSDCDVKFQFNSDGKEIDFRLRTNNSEIFSEAFDKVIELAKNSESGFVYDEYEYNPEKSEWESL